MTDTDKIDFLDWMYGLTSRGIKLDLENTMELLKELGDPQKTTKYIHVAGTDGKGSISACIASILIASGIRTGLYTSPHLLDFNERISVNGEDITDEELIGLIERVLPIVKGMEERGKHPTFFEITTAMAFLHFKEKGAEYVVAEVGMGGRSDSTNVIVPDVCVISNISMDHTEFLGDTIEKIAEEKAGILKKRVPCVTINTGPALRVIEERAEEIDAPLFKINGNDIKVVSNGDRSVRFEYKEEEYEVSIPGRYQALNASVAIEAVSKLDIYGQRLRCNIREGLRSVTWPCRMENQSGTPFILDVTHTSAGAKALAENIREIYGDVVLVLGILGDKDAKGISEELSKIAYRTIITSPDSDRSMPAEHLRDVFVRYSEDVQMEGSVPKAMEKAMGMRNGRMILVTGSFHMAEEALRWLKRI